jgi:hypothetical protein
MPLGYEGFAVIALALGCTVESGLAQTPPRRAKPSDTLEVPMRTPADPYRMGPPRPEWKGSAFVTEARLVFEFPALEPDNVGCAGVDSLPSPARRRYYWLATATYADSHYPSNHFQQVALNFMLAPAVAPTRARLDSVFAATHIEVAEAGGEPPMNVGTVTPERSRATLEQAAIAGRAAWRTRVVVEGKAAVQAFLSAGADSVSLSWCQRDQWLTFMAVPLERR